jgi:glycosyltransferase involved in cell wall biosynthesis
VVISEYEYQWVLSEFGRSHVSFIPLGVDSARYAMGTSPREQFCLTVCWMKRSNATRKSMFELIAAIPLVRAEVPDLRFVIAGSLEDGGRELQNLARRLGVADAVEFPGRIGSAEKIRLMQTCQIYLQPTRFEGFGMAIAEAMSCGAPVVTSPVGSVPEVVGGCARFVDGTVPESIAEGVVRLSRDPQARGDLSLAARTRIEQEFSLERRREGLSAIIDRLLVQDRRRHPVSRPPGPLDDGGLAASPDGTPLRSGW